MNTSTLGIRFGLLTLLGISVLGIASWHPESGSAVVAAPTRAAPIPVLDTITVHPDGSERDYVARNALPVLPIVTVTASKAEMLAARIDPTDRIQVMGEITVRATAEDLADAKNAEPGLVLGDSDRELVSPLSRVVAEPHRLRLDMPYYSFGKILVNGQ